MSDPEGLVGRPVGPFVIDRLQADRGDTWVFAAHRTIGGGPVALKILKPRHAGDSQRERRFRREADVAARLHHPNVVAILGAGREGAYSYLAMPLYRHSLASLLAERGRLDEATTVRIGRDVAAGLACAHVAGIVHRDVKPANILLTDDGTAVIADFGIARNVSSYQTGTAADVTIGTPQYTSPEQAQGLPLDGRSDLYSLGVALYRAATGDVPFRSTDWFELARMHVEEPVPGARTRAPELSARFERVLERCLAKRPEARFGSAAELTRELEALLRR